MSTEDIRAMKRQGHDMVQVILDALSDHYPEDDIKPGSLHLAVASILSSLICQQAASSKEPDIALYSGIKHMQQGIELLVREMWKDMT